MFIENEELIRLNILDDHVDLLHTALENGEMTENLVRLIFRWPKDNSWLTDQIKAPAITVRVPVAAALAPEQSAEPITQKANPPEKTIVPPPPKPMTSKKGEMMAKVKSLHLKGLNGKQIAEKTGLSESTVSTYKKEMGLIGEASLTLLNSPGNCSGATAVGN